MRICSSFKNFTLFSFRLLIFLLCFFCINMSITTSQLLPNALQNLECSLVNCGEGTCTPSNATLLGVDCICKPGWKQIQIGPLIFPSCALPNCTVDFQCGNQAPPPPPPPQQPFNATSPCNLIWCGDGNCVANGTGHYCQCNDGSANLLDNTAFACFKQCYFGGDCNSLGLGPPPPPPSTSSGSQKPGGGSNGAANGLKSFQALIILVLFSSILSTRI